MLVVGHDAAARQQHAAIGERGRRTRRRGSRRSRRRRCAASERSLFASACLCARSIPRVGSSSATTAGAAPPPIPRPASTTASARRWRSPPERSRGSASSRTATGRPPRAPRSPARAAARRARARAGSSRPGSVTRAPRHRSACTRPRSGRRSPAATRSSVLLPAPLRPSRATVSPRPTREARGRAAPPRPAPVPSSYATQTRSSASAGAAARRRRDRSRRRGALRGRVARLPRLQCLLAARIRRDRAPAATPAPSFTPIGSGRRPAEREHRAAGRRKRRRVLGGPFDELARAGRRRQTRPPSSTTTRSAAARQRSMRCSASTTVAPHSSLSRRSCQISSSPATGSSCEVGSSRSSSRGCADERGAERDALQLASRERVRATGRAGPRSRARAPSPRPRARCPPRPARGSPAAGELGPHRRHHDLRLGVLEERARDGGDLRRAALARVEAADDDAAGELAAVEVRDEAGRRAQQRRLAAGGSPRQEHQLAFAQLQRRRPRSAGGTASRVAVGEAVASERASGIGCTGDSLSARRRCAPAGAPERERRTGSATGRDGERQVGGAASTASSGG